MVGIWLFHPKKSFIFIPFIARNFFWMLFGYMQPKKRTLIGVNGTSN
jgi:hypothetical protein